jgi:hypothetical protein
LRLLKEHEGGAPPCGVGAPSAILRSSACGATSAERVRLAANQWFKRAVDYFENSALM